MIDSFYTAITIIYDVMMCYDDVTFNETPLAATITTTGVIGNESCNSEGQVDVYFGTVNANLHEQMEFLH